MVQELRFCYLDGGGGWWGVWSVPLASASMAVSRRNMSPPPWWISGETG